MSDKPFLVYFGVFRGTVNWVQIDLGEDAEDADLITRRSDSGSRWRVSDDRSVRRGA